MALCGLDFGTSNSTVGVLRHQQAQMTPLEKHPISGAWETTLPSALFFDFETDDIHFGRDAIRHYSQGEFGRLMRSMKSILGSNQMNEGTQIKATVYSFQQIIGFFMNSLKTRAEAFAEEPLTSVVLGRPVHFNDHHPELDQAAEETLAAIARNIGFTDVSFQFEPIAAAYDYEQQTQSEELALIIDMGGGTSDFTLIKLSPEARKKSDRSNDLLANHGIHIGGTDFDRLLSMATVMPQLGLNMVYRDKPNLAIPRHYFVDLATWHRIHHLYEPKVLRELSDLRRNVVEPERLDRLMQALRQKDGHRLAGEVEAAKIQLSEQDQAQIELSFLDELEETVCSVSQAELVSSIATEVERVFTAVDETLLQAGVNHTEVQTIFTTGGSTALPSVRQLIASRFPAARQVRGDLFNSVGKGLVLEAQRRYG
ncbi:Hsp70 family protein [Reinekea blandensis]|uniref:Probable heat-shock protein Hsp 70 n=1 Tax=Reinekea blandensis MED297 TaxID=314283 RepID=A4BIE5_9GAMM|nr:Hsp70 family protein [Reinekea blandensis]EAR08152.1 probable heat-shock protein Hsp 70 [Reinekea sp. MED297] [Reinekea blandensis MED297]